MHIYFGLSALTVVKGPFLELSMWNDNNNLNNDLGKHGEIYGLAKAVNHCDVIIFLTFTAFHIGEEYAVESILNPFGLRSKLCGTNVSVCFVFTYTNTSSSVSRCISRSAH
jgi:hypothetical protein